jgi:hypothetical protein
LVLVLAGLWPTMLGIGALVFGATTALVLLWVY